jgi:hypothetical protein
MTCFRRTGATRPHDVANTVAEQPIDLQIPQPFDAMTQAHQGAVRSACARLASILQNIQAITRMIGELAHHERKHRQVLLECDRAGAGRSVAFRRGRSSSRPTYSVRHEREKQPRKRGSLRWLKPAFWARSMKSQSVAKRKLSSIGSSSPRRAGAKHGFLRDTHHHRWRRLETVRQIV